jgi:hypothetical protein
VATVIAEASIIVRPIKETKIKTLKNFSPPPKKPP